MNSPILVICPCVRDRRNLLSSKEPVIFDDYTSFDLEKYTYEDGSEDAKADDMAPLIDSLVKKYENIPLAGIVTSDDYPGALIGAILAKKRNLPAPSIESLLCCQHKYYSRIAQKESIPEAVPNFTLIDPAKFSQSSFKLSFPCFLKPVKSYLSRYAQVLHSQEELVAAMPASLPCPSFLKPLNQLLKQYSAFELTADYLIAEELLQGLQATIDGYVFNGKCQFLGIVDSIMFPGTISFKRFEYPSSLPPSVQNRIEELVVRFIKHIGYDNGLFNVEFFYNPVNDSLHIIEINSRLDSQFADLFEKVDGTNSYDVAVSIAKGIEPKVKVGKGAYKVAASFVLREFSNKTVRKIPHNDVIEELKQRYPQTVVEVLCREGKRLSEELQDGKSYRYGLIHLGAENFQELEAKFQDCKKTLDFRFD